MAIPDNPTWSQIQAGFVASARQAREAEDRQNAALAKIRNFKDAARTEAQAQREARAELDAWLAAAKRKALQEGGA